MHDVLRKYIRQILRESEEGMTAPEDWMIIGSSKDKDELHVTGKAIAKKWGSRFTLQITPSPTLPRGYDLRLKHN